MCVSKIGRSNNNVFENLTAALFINKFGLIPVSYVQNSIVIDCQMTTLDRSDDLKCLPASRKIGDTGDI